jgi:HlyD family secretion protein
MNLKWFRLDFLDRLGKWRWPALIGGGILLLLVVFWIVRSAAAPNLATVPAMDGEFIIDIKESGELYAVKSVSVGVPSSIRGNLRVVALVEDGTMVKKDDFLLQFDTSEAAQETEDRKNEYEAALAELSSLQANIKSTMSQLQTAYQTQLYSNEQAKLRMEQMKYEAAAKQREQELNLKMAELALDQAKRKLESQEIINKADITKAELKVKQARLRLEQKQLECTNLTLRAPIDGLAVLQEVYGANGRAKIKVGDTPWRGMTLVEIPDLSQMMIKAKVNEVNISQVKSGQLVIATVDALPGIDFYGKVERVAALASREGDSDVKTFDVEIVLDGSDLRLRPGMTAQCRIITDKFTDKLFVPIESVFQKDDTTVVYVKRTAFQRRPVKVGVKNSDYIIIEAGLKKGEEVALRDPTLPIQDVGGQASPTREKKAAPASRGGGSVMIIR